jgi:hypothetical protein
MMSLTPLSFVTVAWMSHYSSWPCVLRTISMALGGSLKWSVEARPVGMKTSYHVSDSRVTPKLRLEIPGIRLHQGG